MRDEIFAAEIVRVNIDVTCQASQVAGVRATMRVHFETGIVRPGVHDSRLCVVCRHAVTNCPDEVAAFTPLRWIRHAALLTDRRATEVGVLVAEKVAEVVRTDLLHACNTLQGVPEAADDVRVMATTPRPRDLRADLCVVPREAVSQCYGVVQPITGLRGFRHAAAVLPGDTKLRMGRRVL